jgi:hypothetical protein
MDVGLLIQIATLISVIVGVVSLIISIRAYRRQVGALFLLEYTRRVDDLLQSLPPEVWALNIIREQPAPPPSYEMTLTVLRCMNLLGQLHFFSRKGYMPAIAWRRGTRIYAKLLQSELFRREWHNLQHIFAADKPFVRFVERAQRGASAPTFEEDHE